MPTDVLMRLAEALATGAVRVVDLTQTLQPSTPVIQLPPQFGASNPFRIEEISHYDDRGPGWYWNNISLGEHTGTHFDAPIHWVTGKDYRDGYTDTIPVQRFMAPACVIDCSKEAAADEKFLLEPAHNGIEFEQIRNRRMTFQNLRPVPFFLRHELRHVTFGIARLGQPLRIGIRPERPLIPAAGREPKGDVVAQLIMARQQPEPGRGTGLVDVGGRAPAKHMGRALREGRRKSEIADYWCDLVAHDQHAFVHADVTQGL